MSALKNVASKPAPTMIIARKDFPSVQLLLIIINRKDNSDYGKKKRFQYNNILIIFLILETVKRVGDFDLKIPTHCVEEKKVVGRNGPNPSTMVKTCLKLNAKLGGINNLISRDFR